MSRTRLEDRERAQLSFVCRYCGAAEGKWCQTVVDGRRTGIWVKWLHTNRYWSVMRIVKLSGWYEYERESSHRAYQMRGQIHQLIRLCGDFDNLGGVGMHARLVEIRDAR